MTTLLAIVAAMALGGAPSAPGQAGDEAREIALWEIVKEGRMDEFAATLSDDFVAVYAAGMKDKDGEIAAMREQKLESFAISGFSSRSLDPNSTLITYSADVRGSYAGADISGRHHVTSVWKRAGGDWKMAYHNEVKAD